MDTEAKWYKIQFLAKLTDDDCHAMKEVFYDTMNECMGIRELAGLTIDIESESSTGGISTERKDAIIFGLINIIEEDRELIYPAEEIREVMSEEEMAKYCELLLFVLREDAE